MSHALDIIGTAFCWGLGGAIIAWLITWPLRRRSQAGLLVSLSVLATFASVAAIIGNTRAMFLADDDVYVTIVTALIAGTFAAAAGALAARTFARDKAILMKAIGALGEEQLAAASGQRLSTELESVRTTLAETARTLTETRDRERALEQSRRELLAWVSHDLRTPLAGLRAMSEALEDGLAPSPARYHRQIRIEVDRLTGMVEDLFEISRLQAESTRPRSGRVDLVDVVSDCLAAMDPLAHAHGVRLAGQADPDVHAEVTGEASELSRAVTNLVVNAVRHTAPGGSVLVTLGSSTASGERRAEISVRDECGGIAEVDLGRVFDVGYRSESARTPAGDLAAGSGAGLGLSITRGILTAHRGTVEVRNVDRGCAFTMRLPVV